MVVLVRPVVAQSTTDQPKSRLQRPSYLSPPSKELIEQGLQPLSAKLPDTRLREGILPMDVSQGVFDAQDDIVRRAPQRRLGADPLLLGCFRPAASALVL